MVPLSVIIVGAGPSGLLLARLLSRSGIRNIKLLEANPIPTRDYRAVFYQPISIHEFKRAGVWDEVRNSAHQLRSVCWRDAADGGKRLFGMPSQDTWLMSVDTLTGIVRRHVEQDESSELLFNHRVINVGQDEDIAWVTVDTPTGPAKMEASYVVACDGAQSTVRRSVFGAGVMEGFTWDKQLVAANIQGDLSTRFPDIEDSNIFLHQTDAWLLFRLPQEPDTWRVIYRDSEAANEELVSKATSRIQKLLASGSEAPTFKLLAANPYRIHQRLVPEMVKGRVILAADAAHLCCPYGALGLNGGIADVGSLSDCLAAIYTGDADASILDVYSRVRREKWQSHIDPVSQRTMKMVFSNPTAIIPDHPLYKMCKMLESEQDALKKHGKSGPDPLILQYDFSQHFNYPRVDISS
ncbi:monooxygenase [Fusarium pseudocircinatum]|uniref:Monooxygenase n=1 Tax=Fusarium pseudocircinatum TaxID=56676 RepID=A0A8H5NTP8_9HYPO|nr:monooxygenase [Fusarium pseudocircinatum]